MRIVAVVCNIVLCAFTCFVLLTDGISKEVPYQIFSLLLLLVPILSTVVLLRSGMPFQMQKTRDDRSLINTVANRVAIISNIVLVLLSCWAIVAQYPHPKDDGLIAYTLFVVFTPIINIVVLLGILKSKAQEQQKTISHQEEARDA